MRHLSLALWASVIVSSPLMGDPIFTAQISITPSPFCTASPSVTNSPQAAFASGHCSFFAPIGGQVVSTGNSTARADASDGHVGVNADVDATNSFGVSIVNVVAEEQGTVIFTGNSGQTGAIVVDFNINFGGIINAAGLSSSGAAFEADLNGARYGIDQLNFSGDGSSTCLSLGTFICDANFLSGHFETDPVLVSLNTPVAFELRVGANAGDGGGPDDSARADFGNSLDLPIGSDIFNLPDGFTANSTDFDIVDNRLAGADAGAPEPSTFYLGCLSILAFATVGLIRHLRRRPAVTAK